ncbi:hypothetical protein [Vulcanisaeta sp. JCM 14467]|uniref:hypothetical protein n=1 Tax=Vulcanisaeta sp. JCM 14467 TaxID=1295370 RepID=UPI0020924BB4|nr:hypothetical protein [Vulcanisaeta sp. JCM 14467]
MVIAVLASFHFNVNNIEQTIYSLMGNSSVSSNTNPSYVSVSATVSRANDVDVITISVTNNGNNQLILSGTTIIGSAQCNLQPSIIIPPRSTGEITLLIYMINSTMTGPVTVNLGGSAYSPGTPQIFCYSAHFSLSAYGGPAVVFSTVNGGNIYVNLNQ